MLDSQEHFDPPARPGGGPARLPDRLLPDRLLPDRLPDRLPSRSGPMYPAEARHAARESLEDWLDSRCGDPIADQHRWALLPPGKLLRPTLLLESAAAVGGRTEQVAPAATGFELMHAGSLIHDDIIDGDETRRGRAANHIRYGLDRAVVAADALFFAVFGTLDLCRARGVPDRLIVEATSVIAEAGADITRGATMELDLSGSLHDDTAAYLEMARLKTAALLRAACRTGAVLAGGTAEETAALSDFGEALGIAFQINDDLLPYIPPGTAAGKPHTSDLRNGRPTLPLLLAHRDGCDEERALLAKLLTGDGDEEHRQDRLHRLLEETGALKAAQHMANEYLDRCRGALEVLAPSPHRHRLAALADQSTGPQTARRRTGQDQTGQDQTGPDESARRRTARRGAAR